MRLDGTETIGTQSHHILVDSYWDTAPSGDKILSRAKIQAWRDDVQRYLTIGDGTNLWILDVTANEYMNHLYGSYTSKQPDDYQQVLLQSQLAGSRGPSMFPARLLRDIYGGSAATYKTWMPNVTPTETNGVITYSTTSPLTRMVQYVLDQSTGALISMSYTDVKGNQEVSWTLNFYSFLSPPADWNFGFVPPPGSTVVADVIH